MFRVDQKVVCVDVSPAPDGQPVPLVKNRIYVIKGFAPPPSDRSLGRGLYLFGVDNGSRNVIIYDVKYHMDGYRPTRFRPVQEKKTDIGLLTALLNPVNHKVLEDAIA